MLIAWPVVDLTIVEPELLNALQTPNAVPILA